MTQSVIIRVATLDDASALADLTGELGYSVSTAQMKVRLETAGGESHHSIFVAESGSVVGWIQVSRILTLESGTCAEIRGLVVAKTHRKLGIGRKLVAAGERWAALEQCNQIRVRTNVIRDDARSFYSKLGYAISKTQTVFDKLLTPTT